MSRFSIVKRLEVWRRLADASRIQVGILAQNRQGVFFQYSSDYQQKYANLSPFTLDFDTSLQTAPPSPHAGLHGVFADSLPDGWGLLLMDRVFRQAGVSLSQITAMDRLAFVGNRGMGALEYVPISDFTPASYSTLSDIATLGLQAQAVFDAHISEGSTDEILAKLVRVGHSGGARPKAQLYLADDHSDVCSVLPQPGMKAYLLKFTSSQLALGHEEGLCEAAYLQLAGGAGIDVPRWRLIAAPKVSGASAWLAVERFDCTSADGRLHLHSACGLLDADFRIPSLDYEDLIKASSMLCKSPAAGQAQFRCAVFNLFALNQDDHSKNWAFLQDDHGQWQLAPFYDVTFSPNPYGEHATAFAGFGKIPSLKAMQKLASVANFSHWSQAQAVIKEVVESLGDWGAVAKTLGVSIETRQLIARQLNEVREQNKHLLTVGD